jgi:AraC-like DNA-binding protein
VSAGAPLHRIARAGEAGRWEMVLGTPDPRLAGSVAGGYVGWSESLHQPTLRREVPKSFLPVVLNFGAPYEVFSPGNLGGGLQPFQSFLAGAHDSFALTRQQVNRCLQFNLSFLGAFRLLRLPMDSLANRVVGLDALLGRSARALVEELGNREDWEARFGVLDRWLLRRLEGAPPVAPEVRAALAAIDASGGTLSIGALAAGEGISRKRLIALFRATVGLAPKRIARLVRFQRAMALLLAQPGLGLAAIAQDSGYSDQPHMNRDFRAMAGTAPNALLAELPLELLAGERGGKNVQDGTSRAA